MSADWKKELESMKKETEEEIEKGREEERKLREKHAGEKEKLVELIHAQLKPVEESFKVEGADKNQTLINIYLDSDDDLVSLHLPSDHGNRGIYFRFTLTDKGYAVNVRREMFDIQREHSLVNHYIKAPVTVKGIKKEIREFIRDRNERAKWVEEERRRKARGYG